MGGKKKRKLLPWSLFLIGLLVVVAGSYGYRYYQWIFDPNVDLERKVVHVHVPSGGSYEDLMDTLITREVLKDVQSFRWVAEQKELEGKLHPGKYRIEDGMSNNALVNMFRGGLEETVKVTFNLIRTKKELAGKATRNIELDSTALLDGLKDPQLAEEYGFKPETFMVIFIPNTYEFYWDVALNAFLDRMKKEYDRFWTKEREHKAERIGLSKVEVSILASIVEAEQSKKPSERPKIARLFLNRLDKGMKLESDPTLVYAIGDFSIQRVLDKDRDVDSPYNTYRYKGLPPGPIRLPSQRSIEAVLNAPEHDHIYMCAKPDSSGLHNFASTYSQHLRNARKYQAWLNDRGVYR